VKASKIEIEHLSTELKFVREEKEKVLRHSSIMAQEMESTKEVF
jgi:hypothetical protein